VDPGSPEVRASDAERDRTASALGDAAAEGRLTLEELTERLDAAYAAKSRGELEALTADLPQRRSTPRTPRRRSLGIVGGTELRGRFRVEGVLTIVNVIGGAEIDLREAEVIGHELEIRCINVIGGVELTVPDGVDVSVELVSVLGGKDVRLGGDPRPGAPLIRLTGFCALGGVEVRTRHERRRGLPLPPLRLP
jgi:hypothetical protein